MEINWFSEWVGLYVQATGSNERVRAALLACRHTFLVDWSATPAELGEVTSRLISGGRVPEFAPAVTNALGAELRALRAERAEEAAPPDPPPGPAQCRWCGDTGWVAVPHPRCVEAPAHGPPRLVAYRHRGARYRDVLEVSVLCDLPFCDAGRRTRDAEGRVKSPRPTLSRYLGGFAGQFDPVELLALHNRARAGRARRSDDRSADAFRGLMKRILARVAAAEAAGEGVAA